MRTPEDVAKQIEEYTGLITNVFPPMGERQEILIAVSDIHVNLLGSLTLVVIDGQLHYDTSDFENGVCKGYWSRVPIKSVLLPEKIEDIWEVTKLY